MTSATEDKETNRPGASIRKLSPLESVWVLGSGYASAFTMLMDGHLDLEALDEAFVELQHRNAALRVVVRKTGPNAEFVWSDRPPTGIQVFEGEDFRIRPTGREAVFDQTERLTQLHVVPGGDQNRVTWFIHHVIADGAPSLTFFNELWELYTHRVETGGLPPRQVRPFPQSGEHFLNTRDYPGATPRPDTATLPEEPPQPPQPAQPAPEHTLADRVVLGKTDTAALAAFAKANKVPANALISAALIRAHHQAEEPPVLYGYSVDLRNRIAPPVGATEATNLVSVAFVSADVPDLSLIPLARTIQDQLAHDVADGTIHRPILETLLRQRQSSAFGCIVHTANLGRMPELRLPRGLRLADIQFFLPATSGSALSSRPEQPTIPYQISWFDQQLRIDPTGKQTEGRAELLARIEEELRLASAAHAG